MKRKLLATSLLTLSALSLNGCFHEDDDDMHDHTAMYQITVTNLTNNQALTPPAVVFHNGDFKPWTVGSAASSSLEKIAEGGDSTDFMSDAEMNASVVATKVISAAPIAPGESANQTLDVMHSDMLYVSLASMLANTNDAFTGVDMVDVADLAEGESTMLLTMAYDAGTELNTEAAGTIPGPADGGTGYDATRDDIVDFVSMHPGVVTMDDGLATSVLDESHRWNGPVAQVVIKRMHATHMH